VSADRALIYQQFASVVAAIDPDTGDLAGATALPGAHASDISDDDLRHGLLWIHGKNYAAPDALPWAAFDLTTGQLRHASGGIVGPDPTAGLRAKLGW
jgi:hypothetical protein